MVPFSESAESAPFGISEGSIVIVKVGPFVRNKRAVRIEGYTLPSGNYEITVEWMINIMEPGEGWSWM